MSIALISLINFLISFILGIHVISKNPRSNLNIMFSLNAFSLSLLSFIEFILRIVDNLNILHFWVNLAILEPFAIGFLFHFSILFADKFKFKNQLKNYFLIYLPIISFFLLDLIFDWHIKGIEKKYWGWKIIFEMNLIFIIYIIWINLLVISSIVLCLYTYFKSSELLIKKQAKFVSIGIICAFISFLASNLIHTVLIPIEVPLFGNSGFTICCILFFYAIKKYGLFELKIANIINRSIMYLSDCLILTNNNNEILEVNKSTLNLLSYNKDELIGRKIDEILLTQRNGELLQNYNQLAAVLDRNMNIKNFELWFKSKDGTKIPLSISSSIINSSSGLTQGILYIGKDITESKQLELYNMADFYKDLFTHDINNIFQNFLSAVQLSQIYLSNPDKLKNIFEILQILEKSVLKGTSLVTKIRKLSELNELNIPLNKVDFIKVLRETIVNIKEENLQRNTNIRIDTVKDNLFILANDYLKDVYENILNNAIYHNDNDPIEITICVSRELRNKESYVRIEFHDNARGIEDSIKKILFLKEFVKDKGTRGLGLGLSLVKKIIDSYNGKIWVENRFKENYQKGSKFIILIPEAVL